MSIDVFLPLLAPMPIPRLLQMDISMPFMGGMEATELIRSYEMHRGLSPMPIIALTAHASTSCSRSPVVCWPIFCFTISDWRSRAVFAGWHGKPDSVSPFISPAYDSLLGRSYHEYGQPPAMLLLSANHVPFSFFFTRTFAAWRPFECDQQARG